MPIKTIIYIGIKYMTISHLNFSSFVLFLKIGKLSLPSYSIYKKKTI